MQIENNFNINGFTYICFNLTFFNENVEIKNEIVHLKVLC